MTVAGYVAEGGSALAAIFPPTHTCRQQWGKLAEGVKPGHARGGTLDEMSGVLLAATALLKGNRIGGMLDAVRAETVGELLEQAKILLGSKHVVAAAVIAGGALERHLLHLVTKNGLAIAGEGSISKYDQAIGKARNDGTATVYSATDSNSFSRGRYSQRRGTCSCDF